MSASIFIKTWKNDIEWVKYCTRSIQKYSYGIDEVVIVADESCKGMLDNVCTAVTDIHYVPEWKDGRIQQQAYKLLADTYCKSEFIIFTDSDTLFTQHFSINDFLKDGKPILLKTKYEKVGDAKVWRKPTQEYLGFNVEWEYMRRMPLVFRRDTITALREAYPWWHEKLKTIRDTLFSEFNVMGGYAEKHEADKYFITDTEVWTPHNVAKQFWSWGGLPENILSEIKSILHEKW